MNIDYLGVFIIPVATAILTTFALLIKEWLQGRNITKRALTEKKLVELYNHLYSIVVRYEGRLQITYRKEVYDIGLNGQEKYREIPEAEYPELWDEAIKAASGAIYNKIHLLEYDDLIAWLEVENVTYEEDDIEDYSTSKAFSFRNFMKKLKKSYGRLYDDFHLNKKKKKGKINALKKQIKNIKNNPFMDRSEKKDQKRGLKARIKRIKQG